MLVRYGTVRVRVRQTDENRLLKVSDNGQWRTLLTAGPFAWIDPVSLNKDATGLYLISNVNRDKAALMLMRLSTAEQTLLYEHPSVDVQSVYLSRRDKEPLAAFVEPDHPAVVFFDSDLESKLSPYLHTWRKRYLDHEY